MKTTDFRPQVSSTKLKENIAKQFGKHVNLEKYGREQLEDMRNKLRTRVFQYEGAKGFNDLLHNESYQQDKAMLELLNTRIKEMLGEQMQKLRDRMDQLSEAKKGTRPPKTKITAKGSKPDYIDLDKDGNKAEPMKKAAKDAKVKEAAGEADDKDRKPTKKTGERDVTLPSGAKVKARTYQGHQSQKADKEAKFKKNDIDEGKHPSSCDCNECSTMEGKDEGKPGKNFKKIADKAGKKYGSKAAGERVAGAVRAKLAKQGKLEESNFKSHVRMVNESLAYLLAEDEEGKAKAITAAGDMVNDFTSWMQRVGQYQTKTMIELADAIKADFGAQEAEQFKQAVAPALSSTLETLTQQREAISAAVAVLAGEATPEAPMGAEPGMDMPLEPGMDAAGPDAMNPEPAGDEFGASDAAAGGPEAAGRAMRESKEQRRARKLAEAHNLMSKLAK
jgi:hypothetical protein